MAVKRRRRVFARLDSGRPGIAGQRVVAQVQPLQLRQGI